MFSSNTSHRRTCLVLLAFMAMGGCTAGPDLRVSDEAVAKASYGEGKRLLEEGRAVEAVTAFRRHVRAEGASLEVLNGLAIAYGELGKPDLSTEMFSRALAIAPGDPATLNNIGFSALRRADERLARHYLEKARRGQGDDEKIAGNLVRLALLQEINRKPAARPALAPAVMSQQERQFLEVNRIAVPGNDAETPSTTPIPKARQPKPLPRSMVDFTAVIDPFSWDRAAR